MRSFSDLAVEASIEVITPTQQAQAEKADETAHEQEEKTP